MVGMLNVVGVAGVRRAMRMSAGTRIAVERGLKRAGLFVQRESQKIVPVDTGALKNSAGTSSTGFGWNTTVAVFYTQSYAIYVHERTELRHKPGKRAKFLESVVREQRARILAIIAGIGK